MKKYLAMILALVMALSLVACGDKQDDAADNNGDTATGSVYWLNFKPEADATLQKVAAMYTEKTGVPVTVVTAASGTYNETLTAEMDKSAPPTLFVVGNQAAVETWGDYCYDLTGTPVLGELTNEAAQDFMNYIMSEEGQAIVAEDYIPVSGVEPFESNGASGTVTVSGSSSVSPLMQKLIEGYNTVNPNVEIELQTSDSTTGMTDAINGMSDIGMASRELKQEELDAGLVNTVIATDGIAIIVNPANPVESMTVEEIEQIFTGAVTTWEGFQK